MPNWEAIRKEWETSRITFKELAEKHDLKDSTIRSRKNREKWQRNATEENATQHKKNVATKKKRKVQKNRSGNPNPPNQFSKRNRAAMTHGLFSKYIPQESLDIINEMQEKSATDLIWEQISIQYAAIIRAQRIMFVEDKSEMIKELKKRKESSGDTMSSYEEEWEFQFAWDRQANFMNAQSRAMSELRGLIKQFNEIAFEDDERRLRVEQMQLNINKTKAEIENLNDPEDDKPIEILIKRKE